MKNKQINIRLTEKELAYIKRKSERAKMDMTRFVITAVYKNNINVIEGLLPLSTELRHIGNNLNQLTRLCHEGRISCINLDKFTYQVGEIWKKLNELMKEKK
ncbi:MAG: MobC family plasmid mobilization relaxosome protein [Clostridia bacterium]|nr:MobC family plasmid mobilization relaxosome protein [Clostridia bacterium]MBR2289659.1 MobC family plasmid mobilization relaxosome protein [Clostridia bacterium]